MSFAQSATSAPIAVLADDLTGAAEIAALGARCGRRAVILTSDLEPTENPELVVIDTDTRLEAPEIAAQRVYQTSRLEVVAGAPLLYKKTDSVLRGPVRAELEAIARARGTSRVLLLPANPSLGRIVELGRYRIHGRPVSQTAFARDPHHPVGSDDVVAMLAPAGALPVTSLPCGSALPDRGIAIGDAATAADLTAWAQAIDHTTLPAGAAEFFRALLAVRGWTSVTNDPPPQSRGPALLVSGTITPAGPPDDAAGSPLRHDPPPEVFADPARQRPLWHQEVSHALSRSHVVQVAGSGLTLAAPDGSARIRDEFTALVATLHRQAAFTHLVVEGGATASSIVRHLGWHQLEVVHEWAQGVVTMRPSGEARVDLTIKPGSYAWPPRLWKLWFEG